MLLSSGAFWFRKNLLQFDNLGHLAAVVTPSINNAATGNTFPGGTAYVFQYDVNNPAPERQDDLFKIFYPNQAAPFLDETTRTVDVAAVYASATPRYVVVYGQDPTDLDTWNRVVLETAGDPDNGVGGTYSYQYTDQDMPTNIIDPPSGGSPGDPITFQCTVTDRNGNQRVYGFNAAQMPSMVTVMRRGPNWLRVMRSPAICSYKSSAWRCSTRTFRARCWAEDPARSLA